MSRKIPELVSLEFAFDLCCEKKMEPTAIKLEMAHHKVTTPASFNIDCFPELSRRGLKLCSQNIQFAQEELVRELTLAKLSIPRDNELLHEWQTYSQRVSAGERFEVSRRELDPNSRVPTLSLCAWFILRDILYTHKLPLSQLMTLWASYYVLIMGRPIETSYMALQGAIYSNVYRLHHIDQVIESEDFGTWIKECTPHGFMRVFYSSSDDSEFFKQNRHVVIVSTNGETKSPSGCDPSFRHVTSSVNMFKSSNAQKNAKYITKLFDDLEAALHYGGGCNDNAADAQKEIRVTFDNVMVAVEDCSDEVADRVSGLLSYNGVVRRPIAFGDPYHISNLCVTRASKFAFGEVEKGDHSQIHHRQLLQSIHSLHASDKPFSQKLMDRAMEGATTSVHVKTKREREQRWLVNQRNSKDTLKMINAETADGVSALVAWALLFANESRAPWKRRVGKEVATWTMMPEIMLGLHFEAELGVYFEEVYAWHNRAGPLNSRSGFRMLEIFDLYLGFELPWWNKAASLPESKLPNTMMYLEENFEGDEKEFRHKQLVRGLAAGREELIMMTTKYLFRAPLMFLLACHHEHGAPFLRAVLCILCDHPVDDLDPVILIPNDEGSDWPALKYDRNTPRPVEEQR